MKPRTFYVDVESKPDSLDRLWFTANWVAHDGKNHGQCFFMRLSEFTENATRNKFDVELAAERIEVVE